MFTIEKKHKNTNVRKTIRFTDELNDRMMDFIEKTGISFNELVLKCCEYALDNYAEKEESREK
ncbi:MAG: hypothetical protein FWG44_03020 [Oscillospiraceae bacterium]|nr:hypothetical protein [Oscillospiraceae bacterium]